MGAHWEPGAAEATLDGRGHCRPGVAGAPLDPGDREVTLGHRSQQAPG